MKRNSDRAASGPKTVSAPVSIIPARDNADELLADLRNLIVSARERVAIIVNEEQVMLYWNIGYRMRQEIVGQKRAEYGIQIVATMAQYLTSEFGKGFSRPNLFHMIRFAEIYSDQKIVYALRRQLSWTHFRQLIYLDDPLQRDFYAEMCRIERWSTRALTQKINGMLYERTAISRKPDELIRRELDTLHDEDRLTPDMVFRDPYVLDFLRLHDTYSEKDVESAIIRDLERFLLEMGSDFAFLARQKRMTVDGVDYYLDLLFYHRRLRRLVAIDLKLGRFHAADKGQMELYLRWLAKYEQQPEEESPIGLILCAGKSGEHIELLQLEASSIRVAEYITELPPRDVLEQQLRLSIRTARERLAVRELHDSDNND